MKERRIRIELGFGMEKFITNATADSIIRNAMVPAFVKGDFAGGLESGLKQLMKEARKFVITPADLQRSKQQ
jgi:Beta-propeller domains of methanol dehydrogenase type